MLMQCHMGFIDLLPSLPDAWASGNISGLRARGNIGVDIAWNGGKLTEARLTPTHSGNIVVRYGNQELQFIGTKGKTSRVFRNNGKLEVK